MFKQVVWVPSYRGNTAAHEDNYTKPLKILPYPQGSYSLSLIATIIEKIKRRKTCFTTKLKFILLCLPYVHFAASHAVHFFPQIEANELLIFPLFHETEWASLAILHGYSPFPCCLWQPWGVPWSQMGNLAALASGALRSTPWGTGGCVSRGRAHWGCRGFAVTVPLPDRVAETALRLYWAVSYAGTTSWTGSAHTRAEEFLHPGLNSSVLHALITKNMTSIPLHKDICITH